MDKQTMKRNFAHIALSAMTLLGTLSGVYYFNDVYSLNALKHKAVAMSKQYIKDNDIAVKSSIKTGVSLLDKEGYADDFDRACVKNSYVNVTNNNGKYEYDPIINCSNDDSFYDVMVKTAKAQRSGVSTFGIVEGILTFDVIKSEENPTNQNVEVSIVAKEQVSPVDGWTRSTDGKVLTKVFTENDTEIVTIQSELNPTKKETVQIVVSNIDKVAPTGTITPSTTNPTNQDVILTLKTSEDVKITNAASSNVQKVDDRTYTVAIKQNGSFTFKYVDAAGNSGRTKYTVSNIDKVAPVVSGVKDGDSTTGNVTPTFDKGTATLNGVPFVSGTEVTVEGNYTLVVTDVAGNVTTVNFSIDRTNPIVGGIENDKLYNTDVTPTFNEGTATLNGEDFTSGTTIRKDGDYTLIITDQAGNKTTVTFTIDKTAPKGTVTANITDLTNQDVVLTLKTTEDVIITNAASSNVQKVDDRTYTVVIKQNQKFTFKFKDQAGNTGRATYEVKNIDKVAPVVTGVENKKQYNIDVTPEFNKGTATLNGNPYTSGTKVSSEGHYTLTVTDVAGNKTTVEFTIDKTAPEITEVKDGGYYNTDVTPEFNEGTATLNGVEYQAGTAIKAEGAYTLVVTDLAGNKTTVSFVIDKTAPTGVVVASTTDPINGDVILTLTTSEDVINTNAASSKVQKVDDRTYTVTISKNQTFSFKFKDKAGNTAKVSYTVSNIDKEAPKVVGVDYQPELTKNKRSASDVTVVVTYDEALKAAPTGWAFVANSTTQITKLFTGNINEDTNIVESIIVTDLAGNTSDADKIEFIIDKTAPVVTGVVNGTYYNQNVTPEFNEGTATLNEVEFTSGTVVDQEGTYTLVVTDEVGNTTTVEFTIDKTAPVVTGVVNKKYYNVDVTPEFNEGTATLNGAPFVSGTTVTAEGSYTLVVTDLAGNKTTVEFVIDKTAPVVEGVINGGYYNQNVTPTFNEGTATLNGKDFTSGTVVKNERTYTLVVTDQAGNQTTVEFTIDKTAPVVTGVENNQYYNVDVTPVFSEGVATLNGAPFVSGTTITQEGTYTLVVTDLAGNTTTVNFVIDKTAPVVTGVVDKGIYNVDVTPEFNEGVATLNGKEFTSGTAVTEEGSYTLVVEDLAGNKTTVEFTIDKTAPVVTGVTDGSFYHKNVTPTFNEGTATLNGKEFTSGTKIKSEGSYVLVVTDAAGNTTTVNFVIDKTAPIVTGVVDKGIYNVDVTPTFNEGTATLNGKEFTSGTTVTEEGSYTLIVTDQAGNKTTVEFVIDKTAPVVEGVENNKYYNVNVTPTFNEGTATLNGNAYTSGTEITAEGGYVLVVTDQAGNTTTVNFVIDKTAPVITGVENNQYYNVDVTPSFNEGSATLNGAPFVSGTVVTNEGTYTLVVEDLAGNKTTVEFTIDKTAPVVEGVVNGGYYNQNVTPTFNEGAATLNGNEFTSGTVVKKEKEYTLVVTDKAGNTTTVIFTIDKTAPVVTGVENNQYYNVDVTPEFNEGSATLNGAPFVSGTTITQEGSYTLVVTDLAGNTTTVNFVIDKTAPVVTGVVDKGSYNVDVTPEFNEGVATLNGKEFTSGTTVTEEGSYTLVVEDLAGNKTTVEFTIDKTAPIVEGVVDGKIYHKNVAPTFNEGEATLNGAPFVSGTVLKEEGSYVLVVTDAAGNTTTVNFGIDKTAPIVTGVVDKGIYNVDVTPTFNEGEATLNGKEFINGTVVTEEGDYTLIVTDAAGNTTTVTFTIDKTAPVVTGVKDNTYYNVNVTPEFNEGTATLNGVPFVSGTEISIEGGYVLVVTDAAGNITTVNFVIDKTAPVVEGVKHGKQYNVDVIPTFNEGTATLNGKEFTGGTVVTEEGKHILVVTDLAGNQTKVAFIIDKTAPVVEGVENNKYYSVNVTPTFNEGTATLNGNEFTSGTEVSVEGLYTLVVTDKAGNTTTVVFGIDKTSPVITGVENNQYYNVDVTPEFNEGEATLNGAPFVSGTTITLEGSYTLVVKDLAGNTTTVEFTIDKTAPIVTGVVDGTYYNVNVTPEFNEGEATLNGKPFTSGTVVKNERTYTLVVTDKAGNTTTVVFGIDKTSPVVEGVEHNRYYNVDVTPTFNEGEATLNGAPFVSGTTITQEGSYTLVVTDKAGNTTKVEFVIDKTAPIVTGVVDGTYYNVNVTPEFNEGEATLNGKEFTSGTEITEDGTYNLVVTDLAGNTTTVNFVIDKTAPVVEGVKDNTYYNVNVTPTFNEGVATLNGVPYVSGTEITAEGGYELVVTDAAGNTTIVNFVIDKTAPIVTGVTYGSHYPTDVIPTFNEGEATLNGKPFTSGTVVSKEGKYSLVVTDPAGNKTTVVFVVDKTAPIVTGVVDGKYYNVNVTPEFNEGVATLNGKEFTSGTIVKKEKVYTLVVTDKAGNTTTVVFGIDKTAPIVTGVVDGATYNVDVTPTFNEGVATLNGKPYTNGTVITTDGKYELVVEDLAGNKTVVTFEIDKSAPVVEGVVDGGYYNENVTPEFNEGTATLNGKPYTSGTTIKDEGSYELIVTDKGGNTTTIHFVIDKTSPVIEGVENNGLYNIDVTPTFNEGEATLNGVPFISGTTITADGSYTLVVTDQAGNKVKVKFVVDKTAPTGVVVADTTTLTNKGVILTLTTSEDVTIKNSQGAGVTQVEPGNKRVYRVTVTENKTFTFLFEDAAGNKGLANYTVSNIDVKAPVVTGVTYTPELTANGYSKEDVTVIITYDEAVTDLPEGWAFVEGTTHQIFKVFVGTENDETVVKETVRVSDIATNMSEKQMIEFTIDKKAPVVEGVMDGKYYNQNVTPTFNEGVATLNGVSYVSGTEITAEGTYTLVVADEVGNTTTVNFVVDKTAPVVTGIIDGASYNTAVNIAFNEGSARLNGEKLSNPATITAEGTYTLIVKDLAGNKTTLQFIIDKTAPVVSGVENGHYYNKTVTPTFDEGTATLNGGEFTSGTKVTDEGTYTLVVTDAAGNQTTVVFGIDKSAPVVTGVEHNQYYNTNVIPTFNEGTATLNGQEFLNATEIVTEGTYTLVVTDLAGNKTTVKFTIDKTAPVVEGVVDGGYYNKNVTPTFNEGSATLDGKTYTSGTKVSEEGTHTFIVTDLAGNKTTVEFTIDKTAPVITGVENANYYNIDVIPTFNEGVATLNGVPFVSGTAVTKDGSYTLVVTDLAGNQSTVTFTIDKTAPVVSGVENGHYYNRDLAPTFNEGTATLNGAPYVSGTMITQEGSYNLTIIDHVGNTTSILFTIDKTAPVIVLNGANPQTIEFGDDYTELGATAQDNLDSSIKVSTNASKVNTSMIGNYQVVYQATDKAGNTTTVTRTVSVVAASTANVFRKANGCAATGDCYNTKASSNYIWYSGYLWRVVKVNSDNTLKLITEDSIAGFSYDDASSKFVGSHASEWLNNNFYPTLNNAGKIVVNGNYCSELMSSTTKVRYTCSASSVVNSKVGLLTIDEYNILGGASSFLNNGDQFFTMTPSAQQGVWVVKADGSKERGYYVTEPYGLRPTITLSSAATIHTGKGTSTNPYHLTGDTHGQVGASLNTRKPGEYVNFANKTWRIVKSGPVTRLILDSYYTENGSYAQVQYGTVGTFNTTSGIGKYLNTNVYNSLFTQAEKNVLVKARWYYNTYAIGQNPRATTLVASDKATDAYVGLIRIGDIMSGSSSTSRVDKFTSWTLNSSYQNVWYTSWGGTSDYSAATSIRGVKPVIELNASVKIASGNGTSTTPYRLKY